MIKNDIIDAYFKYRQNIIDRFQDPIHLQVVIIISPKAMSQLMDEEKYIEIDGKADCYYTSMFGRRTPIVIRNDLPENVELVIQSQADYERQEKEKLLDKFERMFGNY